MGWPPANDTKMTHTRAAPVVHATAQDEEPAGRHGIATMRVKELGAGPG
jgi:hypothetical protein